ncbi:MAG: nucleoside triphosphate pyrophosphohydrolase [Ruminococcus sp.]|nr:nucleoside triphosphate pyrophosphohydrolase [Ruminococcus sp.]
MVEFSQKDNYNIDDLIEIVRLLRSEGGCPWDREQTHKSIKSEFIEEACEAIEAIDLEDTALLREELGDVLLQVVFHCRIEEELDSFKFDDVCDEICKKLIVRHPHVFGDTIVNSTDDVLKNWDSIKKETKGQETYTDTLNSVAKSLPALMRAQKVGKRAMRAGMDFRSAEDAMACISSEKAELEEAVASGDKQKIEEELGDLLFSCVNTARHLGIDAELALKAATDKFILRFSKTEELVASDSLDMKELTIEELDVYWDKSKKFFKNNGGN